MAVFMPRIPKTLSANSATDSAKPATYQKMEVRCPRMEIPVNAIVYLTGGG